MRRFFLLVALLAAAVGSAYSQEVAQYRGTTSDDQPIEFKIIARGGQRYVTDVQFIVNYACPSGTAATQRVSISAALPLQRDSSFSYSEDAVDGGTQALSFSGAVAEDTTAAGGLNLLTPRLLVNRLVIDAQLCASGDVTWTAQRVRE